MIGLRDSWLLRNAAAVTLGLAEDQMRRAVQAASHDELVSMLETFSPGRAAGPEWTRTFEPFVERLWTWRDDFTMAALAEVFQARGMAWAAVATALSPEHGARIRAAFQHPAWARYPALAFG